MVEFIIIALMVFVLLLCLGVIFRQGTDCAHCLGMYSKSELLELVSALPEGTQIYISIEKNRNDFYGSDKS